MGIFSWVPQNKKPYLLRILSPPLSSSLLSLHTHVVVFTDRARATRLQSPVCNLAKANCFHSHFFFRRMLPLQISKERSPLQTYRQKKTHSCEDEDDDTTGASGWEFFSSLEENALAGDARSITSRSAAGRRHMPRANSSQRRTFRFGETGYLLAAHESVGHHLSPSLVLPFPTPILARSPDHTHIQAPCMH